MRVLVLLPLVLASCSSVSSTVRDTETIHEPNVRRAWFVQDVRDARGDRLQTIVLCDEALLEAGRELCVRWTPPASR